MASFLEQLFQSVPGGIYGLLPPGISGPLRASGDVLGYLGQPPSGPSISNVGPPIDQQAQKLQDWVTPPSDVAAAEPVPVPRPRPANLPPQLTLQSDLVPPQAQLTTGGGLPVVDRRQPQTPQQYRETAQQQYQAPSAQGLNFGGSPDLGDRLMAGFANFGTGRNVFGDITNSVIGLQTGQRTDPVGMYQQMAAQTYRTLLDNGVPEPQARLAAQNPEAQKAVLGRLFGQPAGTYEIGGMKLPYTIGPSGQAQLITPGSGPSGGGGGGSLGDLINLSQQIEAQGAARKAGAVTQAEAAGKAQAVLPQTLASTDNALNLINAVQNHPGRNSWGSSGISGKFAIAAPGSAGYDYRALIDQLKGQAFLGAFSALRGGGQISNVEGEKATQAIAQLDLGQSVEARDQAIRTLKSVLETGRQNAIRMAQGDTQATPAPIAGGWTQVAPNVRIRQVR